MALRRGGDGIAAATDYQLCGPINDGMRQGIPERRGNRRGVNAISQHHHGRHNDTGSSRVSGTGHEGDVHRLGEGDPVALIEGRRCHVLHISGRQSALDLSLSIRLGDRLGQNQVGAGRAEENGLSGYSVPIGVVQDSSEGSTRRPIGDHILHIALELRGTGIHGANGEGYPCLALEGDAIANRRKRLQAGQGGGQDGCGAAVRPGQAYGHRACHQLSVKVAGVPINVDLNELALQRHMGPIAQCDSDGGRRGAVGY